MAGTIDLGHGYRLVAMDDMNWRLQQLRHIRKRDGSDADEWRDTGNYFQQLSSALALVYERVLLTEGKDVGLRDALREARKLRDSLLEAAGAR